MLYIMQQLLCRRENQDKHQTVHMLFFSTHQKQLHCASHPARASLPQLIRLPWEQRIILRRVFKCQGSTSAGHLSLAGSKDSRRQRTNY